MNVTLDYVGDALNLPPLVTELGLTAVSGIIEGLFDFGSDTPPANRIFDEVFQGYKDATLNLFRLGLTNPNDPWQRAAYTANILNFSQIVQDQGLLPAIQTYASSMFRQSTIQSMINIAGSVSGYIQQQLDNFWYETRTVDGKEIKYLRLPGEDYDPIWSPLEQEFLGLNTTPGEEDIYGINEGGINRWGIFGVDGTGTFGLYNGEMIQILQGDMEAWQRMESGDLAFVELHDANGDVFLVVSPNEDGGYIIGSDFDDWMNNRFSTSEIDLSFGYDEFYEVNKRIAYEELTDEEKQILSNFGISDIDELGSFFYTVNPWEDLEKVAFATEFNEDVTTFINNNPELAYEVISMIIRHSKDVWENNPIFHRNIWTLQNFNYDGYDTSTYVSDVKTYLEANSELSDEQILKITQSLQSDMPDYADVSGFKPSAKLNFIDESQSAVLPNGGKLESSFHTGYTYLKGNDQLLWGKENEFWKGVVYGGIATNIYGKIEAEIGAEYGIFYASLTGETADIIQKAPSFIQKDVNPGGLTLEEGAHASLVLAGNKHDFYGFAQESTDGIFLGFRYEYLTKEGIGADFDIKVMPGGGLLNREREPATQDERDALKLYESFKNKELIADEDKLRLQNYIIGQVTAEIQNNPEAHQYFQDNPDALNNLFESVATFTEALNGNYFEFDATANIPSRNEFLNAINQIFAEGASVNFER